MKSGKDVKPRRCEIYGETMTLRQQGKGERQPSRLELLMLEREVEDGEYQILTLQRKIDDLNVAIRVIRELSNEITQA